jgi:hypothetical protein
VVLERLSYLATTHVENGNSLEQFADRLLAPLHYLLTQVAGPDRIHHYSIDQATVTPRKSDLDPSYLIVRVIKVFFASIAALLLTLPALGIKDLAIGNFSDQHKALKVYLETTNSNTYQNPKIRDDHFIAGAKEQFLEEVRAKILLDPNVSFPCDAYFCMDILINPTGRSIDPDDLLLYSIEAPKFSCKAKEEFEKALEEFAKKTAAQWKQELQARLLQDRKPLDNWSVHSVQAKALVRSNTPTGHYLTDRVVRMGKDVPMEGGWFLDATGRCVYENQREHTNLAGRKESFSNLAAGSISYHMTFEQVRSFDDIRYYKKKGYDQIGRRALDTFYTFNLLGLL